jgi:hypothetical protein
MKKRGTSVVSILLVIIAIILVVIGMRLFNTSTNEDAMKNTPSKVVCNTPYTQVGSSCCLDDNNNKICDNNEEYTKTVDPSSTGFCAMTTPFGCEEYAIDANDIRLIIRNGAETTINILSVGISGCGSSNIQSSVISGSTVDYSITCSQTLKSGIRFSGEITITYRMAEESLDKISKGTIVLIVP